MNTLPIPEWCDAAPDASFSDPGDCAARAGKFERTISRRNRLEYIACAFVIAVFGFGAIRAGLTGDTLMAVALSLTVVGAAIAGWGLWRRASNLDRRPEDACLIHLRRQYEHQYKALRAVPLWYLAPLVPGLALYYFAIAANVAETAGWSAGIDEVAIKAVVSIVIFVAIGFANAWAAASLKRSIDKLDALV